jgi:hypothetical protein
MTLDKVAVALGIGTDSAAGVGVGEDVGVDVGVTVGVAVGSGVGDGVGVAVGRAGVSIATGSGVAVGVWVPVAVALGSAAATAARTKASISGVGVAVATGVAADAATGVSVTSGVDVGRAAARAAWTMASMSGVGGGGGEDPHPAPIAAPTAPSARATMGQRALRKGSDKRTWLLYTIIAPVWRRAVINLDRPGRLEPFAGSPDMFTIPAAVAAIACPHRGRRGRIYSA